jgi:hypothetical protein
MEPVIYPAQSLHLIEMTYEFVDFFWIDKLNHYPKIEAKIDWPKFRIDAEALLQSLGKQPDRDYRFKRDKDEF